jgi:hypothetical protein
VAIAQERDSDGAKLLGDQLHAAGIVGLTILSPARTAPDRSVANAMLARSLRAQIMESVMSKNSVGYFSTRETALRYLCNRYAARCDVRSKRLLAETPYEREVIGHVYLNHSPSREKQGRRAWSFEVGA